MIETGWLIEAARTDTGHQWWAGNGWTRDSLLAVRFARKCDAEMVMSGLFPFTPHRATEHQWGFE